ncbi:YfhO family protein [candidate division WOR-3 bacterium]|nr:YfhO family protein [candidate division WOR-3 bacterium]
MPNMKKNGKKKIINDISWKIAFPILFILLLIAFWKILIPGRILDCGDQLMGIPFKIFAAENLRSGDFLPKWNPFLFGGFPYIGGMHGDVLFPSAFLRIIFSPEYVIALVFFIHFFIAGIFSYLFAKQLGAGGIESLVVAIMYMFSGIIISQVNPGHDGKVIVEALTPGVLFFISKGIKTKRILPFLFAGGLLSLCLISPNVQLTYYLMLGSFVWFLSESIGTNGKNWREYLKDFSFAFAGLSLGLAISAAQFIPFLEYSSISPRQAGRGWDFAISWSMHPNEFFDVMFRGFSGLKENYWGQNPFKLHTEYMGFSVFLIAVLSFFAREKKDLRRALTLLSIAIFFLLVSFGGHTPFYKPFYLIIPGFKNFRAPSISFFMFTVCLIGLASLGFKQLKENKKAHIILTYAALIFLALILISPAFYQILASHSQKSDIAYSYKPEFQKSLILSIMALILTFSCAFFAVKKSEKKFFFVGILALIVYFDLSSLTGKFVDHIKNEDGLFLKGSDLYGPDQIITNIKAIDSLARVMPTSYFDLKITQNGVYPVDNHSSDNYLMANRLYSPGGYHGNQIQRYQDLIGLPTTIMFQNGGVLSDNINLCRLLGIKFQPVSKIVFNEISRLIAEEPAKAAQFADMFGVGKTGLIRMSTGKIIDAGNMVLLVDTLALPKIFSVSSFTVTEDDDLCLSMVHDETIDFSQKAILSQDPGIAESFEGKAQITEYSPDRIRADIITQGPSVFIVNDNYAQGWKAYIDGKETPILRANYSLRAVAVPSAGEHELLMIYSPLSVKIGYAITITAVIIWSILTVFSWRKKL